MENRRTERKAAALAFKQKFGVDPGHPKAQTKVNATMRQLVSVAHVMRTKPSEYSDAMEIIKAAKKAGFRLWWVSKPEDWDLV